MTIGYFLADRITHGNKLDIELDTDVKGCFYGGMVAYEKNYLIWKGACVVRLGGEISIIYYAMENYAGKDMQTRGLEKFYA